MFGSSYSCLLFDIIVVCTKGKKGKEKIGIKETIDLLPIYTVQN